MSHRALQTRTSRRSLLMGTGAAVAGAATLFPMSASAAQQLIRRAVQQDGGTVTVGTVGDLLNLDPFVMAFVNYPIMENVYDQLVRLDHEINPQPWLAESWELSDDYLTLTIHLRSGVRFHSGREITADDVVANFERAGDPDAGGNMYPNMQIVTGATAVDAGTVEVTFAEPAAYIYSALGLLSVIEPEKFDDLTGEAGGSGAFQVQEWVPGDHVTLTRFEDYWNPDRPLVDEVTFRFYSDEGSLVAALEGGVLDIAMSVPPREYERLRDSFTFHEGQEGSNFYYLGLNAKVEPFDNKLVRQAMAHALDRQTLVDNVLFGFGGPIVTPFPTFSPAYFEEHADMYTYDLERARELLSEAGYPDGITFTIPAPSGFPEFGQFAQILQADLATIGSTVEIEPMDNAQWYPILLEGTYDATFSFAGGTQLYPTRIALSGNFSAADNVAWPDGDPPAEYAEALQAADATFDPQEQQEALRRMADAFMEESWNIAFAYRTTLFAHTDAIDGLDWGVYDQIRVDQVTTGS